MRDNTAIVVEFQGGGFVVIEDASRITIYLSRHDIKKVEYIEIDEQYVSGETITKIRGTTSGRVRYI